MSDIITAIRKIVGTMIKPDLFLGKVKSFDSNNWTITVELHQGATVEEVTIRSILNNESTGIFIEPKVGSVVLCGSADGKLENLKVILYSEVVNMELLPKEAMKLRGDQFGGIPKSEKIASEDKKIIDEINKLKQILMAWTPVSQDGGAALKLAVTQWAATSLMSTPKTDYENEKVKHG